MEQWEFLEVRASEGRWTDSAGHAGDLPFVDVGGRALPSVGGLVYDFSAQGWRVVTVEYGTPANNHMTVIRFKRLVPGPLAVADAATPHLPAQPLASGMDAPIGA